MQDNSILYIYIFKFNIYIYKCKVRALFKRLIIVCKICFHTPYKNIINNIIIVLTSNFIICTIFKDFGTFDLFKFLDEWGIK